MRVSDKFHVLGCSYHESNIDSTGKNQEGEVIVNIRSIHENKFIKIYMTAEEAKDLASRLLLTAAAKPETPM